MKRTLYLVTILLLAFAGNISAQNSSVAGWKEKMMSEKIAFFTVEMGITPEEAQAFWPVYNEIAKEKDTAINNVFKTYMALEGALNSGKQEKEITKLLNEYLKAQESQRDLENKAVEKYRKILSAEKLAKLYVTEEKFRRQNIRRMVPQPQPGPWK